MKACLFSVVNNGNIIQHLVHIYDQYNTCDKNFYIVLINLFKSNELCNLFYFCGFVLYNTNRKYFIERIHNKNEHETFTYYILKKKDKINT